MTLSLLSNFFGQQLINCKSHNLLNRTLKWSWLYRTFSGDENSSSIILIYWFHDVLLLSSTLQNNLGWWKQFFCHSYLLITQGSSFQQLIVLMNHLNFECKGQQILRLMKLCKNNLKWTLRNSLYNPESVSTLNYYSNWCSAFYWYCFTLMNRNKGIHQRSWWNICAVFLFVDFIYIIIKPQEILISPQ